MTEDEADERAWARRVMLREAAQVKASGEMSGDTWLAEVLIDPDALESYQQDALALQREVRAIVAIVWGE